MLIFLLTFHKYLGFWQFRSFKEKISIKAIYSVGCYRKYTKTDLNTFLLFLLKSAFCYCGRFSSIFCKNRIPRFHVFIVKMMTSLSLQKRLQITFDRSRRISGASGQWFWNSRFYSVCRVKTNGARKYEYQLNCLMLLKMVVLVKRENLIKETKSCEYTVSLVFKDKM